MRALAVVLLGLIGGLAGAADDAETITWGRLVVPVDPGWSRLDIDSPESIVLASPGDTQRMMVHYTRMTGTPRSFKSLETMAFFWGLRTNALDIGPITETTVAGCPARRFDMTVEAEQGPVVADTWLVLLDPGIYMVSLYYFDDPKEAEARVARLALAAGTQPPPPPRPWDSLPFMAGMIALVVALVVVGVVVIVVIAVRRHRKAPPPPPPPPMRTLPPPMPH